MLSDTCAKILQSISTLPVEKVIMLFKVIGIFKHYILKKEVICYNDLQTLCHDWLHI